MAINITPLVKIVRQTISYKVYNGNLNLTPVDFDNGAVIFTLTGTKPVSTPQYTDRAVRGDDTTFERVWTAVNEYNYQLDIMKTMPKEADITPLVPFELEAFSIVNNLQSKAGELLKDHGLGLSYINTRFMVEFTHSKPTNRMIGTFYILSQNKVRIKTSVAKAKCAEPSITHLSR